MVLKDNAEMEVSFNLRMDGFDYLIYATTDKMRWFGCGRVGHLVSLTKAYLTGEWMTDCCVCLTETHAHSHRLQNVLLSLPPSHILRN